MKYLLFLFLISFNFCLSQENFVNSHDEIYFEDGLVYKMKDRKVFSGTIEFIKKNGVILSKELYENGYLTNEYKYFNKSGAGKVYKEIVYYKEKILLENPKFIKHKIILYHLTGLIYNIKHYDLNGEKILDEDFDNGKLIYSCEYKNGKKNGKEFCISKKCDSKTEYYHNGKRIIN